MQSQPQTERMHAARADSYLAFSPSSAGLRSAKVMHPSLSSPLPFASPALSASGSLSLLDPLSSGSPRYQHPTAAFTSSALSPAASTSHLLMRTSSPRRTAKTFHVEPVGWDHSNTQAAAMSSLSYPQLRAVLSAPPPSVPTPASVSRYKIRCFNNESAHHGVQAPSTIRAHLQSGPQSARKAAVEAITAAAAVAHTRSHVALQSFTDRRHVSPHKPRAPISEPEFRRRLDLAVTQSLQLQYQRQLQRHAEVEMERVFGLTNAPPVPKPMPPQPLNADWSATQTRAPSHSPSMHTLRAPTASPSTASLHASPLANSSKRASFSPPGLQFQQTQSLGSSPRRSSSHAAPVPASAAPSPQPSERADAAAPMNLTVPAEETWEAQQQRHSREQEERERKKQLQQQQQQEESPPEQQQQQPADDGPQSFAPSPAPFPVGQPPAVTASASMERESAMDSSISNESAHAHSQATILTVHSSTPPPQEPQHSVDSTEHADSAAASPGQQRVDSSSSSAASTAHSRHTSMAAGAHASPARGTFATHTRAPKGTSPGNSPQASGRSTPSRVQTMHATGNAAAAAAASSSFPLPVAAAAASSHSTFADVNALLNSALEDAKQSAVRTHANMPSRTHSFKLLHAAQPDGRSTGASPLKAGVGGADHARTKSTLHMRRPSNTLASSLLDDAVTNLLAFSIPDRLESNRLSSDPELRSLSNRAQGRGFNVHAKKGSAAPPPETEMAHWALQVHEAMLEEKRRVEAEDRERKRREQEEAARRKEEEAAKAKADTQAAAVAAMQATPQGYSRRIVA